MWPGVNQEVPLDAGGTLSFEPTVRRRPTSASCTLVTPAAATLATPTVVLDPVDTTTDAAALAGDVELTLDDTTGIVARRSYIVSTPEGEGAEVRVRSVSADGVVLFSPLRFDVPDESSFFGVRMTAPVTAGNAAILDEGYEARWVFTVGEGDDEEELTAVTRWDIVRSAWPADLVTPAQLERYAGSVLSVEIQSADTYGLAFLDELEQAADDVRTDILEQGRRPSLFRSFGAFVVPVMERTLLNMAYLGRGIPAVDQNDPSGYRAMREQRYAQAFSKALGTTKDYDIDESGTATAAEAQERLRVLRFIR